MAQRPMAHSVTWHSCRQMAGWGGRSELDLVLIELPVQGPAADAEEAGRLAEQERPDVVISDVVLQQAVIRGNKLIPTTTESGEN